MTMAAGTRLGPYEIVSVLGAGGMGEVYRARDTQLKRDVAVKVLPLAFSLDADRLARFDREAQALAALNHPHIAQVYGVATEGHSTGSGQADVREIVMELVEGPTLAERLAQGPIPLGEALPLARQLADALEYAHERGIVHRDLKPANIKITPDGDVKVLDFGLAKVLTGAPSAADADVLGNSPTRLRQGHGEAGSPPGHGVVLAADTELGVILGTAAYMAPEQARGAVVDKRADIWAFGVVLFEMLSGKPCFAGDTVTDVLAAILTGEPDWSALPAATPPRLRELLRRCLAKDRRQRLRDIGDARIEFDEVIGERNLDGVLTLSLTSGPRWKAVSLVLALLALALSVGLVVLLIRPPAAGYQSASLRLSALHAQGTEVGAAMISPDGRRLAYRARRADGVPMLWIRALDSYEATPLEGAADPSVVFWSPDSRQVGFYSGGFIKRISANGGPASVVVPVWDFAGATWAPDDTILFSDGIGLFRVHSKGGTATPVLKRPGPDWSHVWPWLLPDGRRFLFTARLWTRRAEAGQQGIYLGTLDDTNSVTPLLPDLSSAVFAPPNQIVFGRNGTLMAAPLLSSGNRVGEPVSLGLPVASDQYNTGVAVSAANEGTLAVRSPPVESLWYTVTPQARTVLGLLDRTGAMRKVGEADLYHDRMALSPNNSHAVVVVAAPDGTSDLWLVDLATGSRRRMTTTGGYAGQPVYSTDGSRLAWSYQPPGGRDDLYIRDLPSDTDERLIETAKVYEGAAAWSRSGQHLLFWRTDDLGKALWVHSFTTKKQRRFASAQGQRAVFSPDDRYVAFNSRDKTGRYEVYVTTFPDATPTWPLTTEGGQVLSWSRDGREILVASLSGHIVAFPVAIDGSFRSTGPPTTIARGLNLAAVLSAPAQDHSRILVRVSPDRESDKGEIRLLFGWSRNLKAK